MKALQIWALIMTSLILGLMLNRAYVIVSVSSWGEGCNYAASHFGTMYGTEYKTYMENICNQQTQGLNTAFHLEE